MFASVPTKETPVLKSSRVTNQENTHTKTKQSEISTKSSVQIGIYAIERGARQHTGAVYMRKFASARVQYRDDYLISYRVHMMHSLLYIVFV